MDKSNNKGFTLIEILAAIVILGIILIISTNLVFRQVNKARKQAFITDVEQFKKTTSYENIAKDKMDQYAIYYFPDSGIDILPKKKTKIKENGETKEVDLYSGFMIKDEDDNVRIQIWNRQLNMCAVKSFSGSNVEIDDSIKTEEDCNSFVPDLVDGKEVSIKSITGENVNYKIKPSCYTLDADNNIDNFNSSECGTVLVVPNKINGNNVNGFTEDFYDNAPKNFTSLYIVGVTGITELPSSLLARNENFKKSVISKLPNLEIINSGLLSQNPNIETFFLTNCPKLTSIMPGAISSVPTSLENLTLEDLPKLTTINSAFTNSPIKKVNISGFDSLTEITGLSFSNLNGDTEVIVSNNPNLELFQNSAFSASYIKSMDISNNPKLVKITNGAISCYDTSLKCYIDELVMHDNPNFETLENGAFQGYEFKNIKLYNMPKLKNIRYSAFYGINAEVMDLSGLELETIDLTAFSNASIDKLILPPTITSITYGSVASLNSIVKDSIEFGGSDKCSLIDLFRTSNGDGTYTYLVDQSKLPNC